MIEEFGAHNFKLLLNVKFVPQKTNLLLGLNNSGKTTLCEAMQFLSDTASHTLDVCADDVTGGDRSLLTNMHVDDDTMTLKVKVRLPFGDTELSFAYELVISVQTERRREAEVELKSESLRVDGDGFGDVLLVENDKGKVRLLHETKYERQGELDYVETTAPVRTTMLNRLYDLETNRRANVFKDYLASWQYYALSLESMRKSEATEPSLPFLVGEGGNLSKALYELKTGHELLYRRLLEALRQVEPAVEFLNFHVAPGGKVYMFLSDGHGNNVPSWTASAGTLRFLALALVLLVQPILLPQGLMVVEEPENGVYVGLLKGLVEAAFSDDSGVQIVFTSHSPYFIDYFDNRLESVFLVKKDITHSTIEPIDAKRASRYLQKLSLGEQFFRELMG